MTTIKLIDQLHASRAIYAKALENLEALTDTELSMALAGHSGSALARLFGAASGSALARLFGAASGSDLARLIGASSGSDLARLFGAASGSALARLKSLQDMVVPIVPDLDSKMHQVTQFGYLEMNEWHSCKTTHCRAGHAINFAGQAGYALEAMLGSAEAGRLIYEASTGRIAPNFNASNEDAAVDIARCAGVV